MRPVESELLTQGILLAIGGVISVVVWRVTRHFSAVLDAADRTQQELAARAEEQRDSDASKTDALCHGMGLLLRAYLVETHERWQAVGYMPADRKADWEEAFDAYESLGFDGVIAGQHKDVIRWPTAPPGGDAA